MDAPNDATAGEWVYQRVEDGFGMNGCVGGDINNDRRPDLICTGSETLSVVRKQGRERVPLGAKNGGF